MWYIFPKIDDVIFSSWYQYMKQTTCIMLVKYLLVFDTDENKIILIPARQKRIRLEDSVLIVLKMSTKRLTHKDKIKHNVLIVQTVFLKKTI